ncbi:hypothetical protein Tco_0448486 [Tanacetum coccineum]
MADNLTKALGRERLEFLINKLGMRIIIEYLVKISKKARILELKRRHLKITVLIPNTPYPSRKIPRICSCTSQKTTKETRSIRYYGQPVYNAQEYVNAPTRPEQLRHKSNSYSCRISIRDRQVAGAIPDGL